MGARASQLLWTGELGADPRWGMRAAVAVLVSCSVLHLLRPWTLCVSAASGQFGPKGPVRGYGMSRAQIAKRVLADVFLYLIVVCSMSKKSLFPWQIPRAEFRALFQDPTRAGEQCICQTKNVCQTKIIFAKQNQVFAKQSEYLPNYLRFPKEFVKLFGI